MHPFSVVVVKFTLNKDNLFKLNTKHEFVQLDRLNIMLNVEDAISIPNFWELGFHYHSQSQKLGIKFFIPIPNPKSWDIDFQFPFLIPKAGSRLGHFPFLIPNVQKSFPLMHGSE